MNKKTKLLITINFILWILAMVLIFMGVIFVFIAGKGCNTADTQLIKIGNDGAKSVGGILIAISAFILTTSILFFSLKLHKKLKTEHSIKTIVMTSFTTTTITSTVMVVMSILDIMGIWSIWPWLINFGLLFNFTFVLFAFKLVTNQKPSNSELLKQIESLNNNGLLAITEYKEIKERAKRILKPKVAQKVESKEENKTQETKVEEQKTLSAKQMEKQQIKIAKVKLKEAKKDFKTTVKK